MKILGLVFLLAVAYAKHEQYESWKSYFVRPTSQEQIKFLGSLVDVLELDFLSYASVDREGIVLIKPEHQQDFLMAMEEHNIDVSVHVADVKAAFNLEDEMIEATRNESRTRGRRDIPFNNYQPLSVYDDFLEDIASRFPSLVTLVTPANTFEGHPIKYVKISSSNFEDRTKPVIVIEGGMHAREWISPPTVAFAISRLVERSDPDLLDRFDWILLPIANPDGYRHSFEQDRMWRKNRSVGRGGRLCPGVDGNRNFDFAWNTVGTSNNPCAATFAGEHAFSEVETQVVRDILSQYLSRIALFLTMHSHGSMILYPWGHDGSLSNNALGLHTVGINMADAIFSVSLPHFPRYTVGNSVLVIGYAASGASEDYAHSVGVPLSYTYELPGLRDGFLLNPRYIEQVCRETWLGIVAGARRAGDLFNPGP